MLPKVTSISDCFFFVFLDDKKIKRFKDQSGFSIYAVLGGVIGTLVITIVVIARQRRKCGRGMCCQVFLHDFHQNVTLVHFYISLMVEKQYDRLRNTCLVTSLLIN